MTFKPINNGHGDGGSQSHRRRLPVADRNDAKPASGLGNRARIAILCVAEPSRRVIENHAVPSPNPLRFAPLFRRYLWGGRRLHSVLGKPIGEGDDYAESWEIVDHDADQSVVQAGHWGGKTLGELVESEGDAILGLDAPLPRFPLLLKYLDCNRVLSVQVHPNDEQAAALDPPDLGKTEAWYVLDSRPGAKVYAGLQPGIDRDALAKAVASGETERCLHAFEPEPGDCIFIPAGVVHALGEGLLVAEIQQASDTTYRLFDWNRVGPDGKPRELHIDAGLDAIDFNAGPISPQTPQPTDDERVSVLIACDKFVLERVELACDTIDVGGDGRFRIITVVQGEAHLEGDLSGKPLQRGESALLPAASGSLALTTDEHAVLLVAFLPEQGG